MASSSTIWQTNGHPKNWWNRNPERGPIKQSFPQCLLPRLSIQMTFLQHFSPAPLKLLNLWLNREYHSSGLWRIPNHFSFLPPTPKPGLREILTPFWRIPNHSGPRLLSNFTRDLNMISAFFLLSTHNQFGDMQASGLFFSEAKDKFWALYKFQFKPELWLLKGGTSFPNLNCRFISRNKSILTKVLKISWIKENCSVFGVLEISWMFGIWHSYMIFSIVEFYILWQ